jgi:chromosome segregation ATPase
MLTDVEKKVSDGLRLQPLFDDLKEMQRKFREAKLTKDHRTKIWDRLDLAFKVIKDKRFGTSASAPTSGTANDGATGDDRSPGERLNRRYEGLMSAIDKMEKSIKRDEDDLDFQKRKVANTDGQLEAQIRQAKILMIEERIRSKREKLGEMLQTREELDRRVETQKERDAKKAEQDKILEAKRAAEEKIKSEIKAAADARKDDDGKLSKAAEQLKVEKGTTPKTIETPVADAEDSLLDAVVNTVSDSVTDVVDTLKAVGIVIGDKIGDLVEDIKEAMETPAAEPEAPPSTETVVEVEDPTAEVEPTIEEPVVEETKEDSEKTEDPEQKDPNE